MRITRGKAISIGLPPDKMLSGKRWDLDDAFTTKAEAEQERSRLKRKGDFRARISPVTAKDGKRWYGLYVRLMFRRGLSDA